MCRLSIVGNVYVNDLGSSSIMHVGDNINTALENKSLRRSARSSLLLWE